VWGVPLQDREKEFGFRSDFCAVLTLSVETWFLRTQPFFTHRFSLPAENAPMTQRCPSLNPPLASDNTTRAFLHSIETLSVSNAPSRERYPHCRSCHRSGVNGFGGEPRHQESIFFLFYAPFSPAGGVFNSASVGDLNRI